MANSSLLSSFDLWFHKIHLIDLKFIDDIFYKQSFYAAIGGISIDELNVLERELLYVLDYQLFVDSGK